ncbi:type IV toxin-antitoxin system AbiEi family antitoxin [Cellulomonas dongxiuzhuiae]|uniref:type IV toxin-antitoxin system AbiEi family antitoxin n=1 Tax=Cellulomonas dongxiuzhuiae TaxID=2819979 RepID=UPI001AAE2C19|nr:type IV toxin-antitoxin system AbiEi family antitoxin [Cellulomonas dongxiuzhuiae]MBO3087321.1 hypothetical protein [Cellulomonas dongxiuzhuiae]
MTPAPVLDMRRLRADGVTWAQVQRLVASGAYVPVFRSVLVRRALLDDPEVRAAAVRAVLPPGGAVCRDTAAWLHGIDVRAPGLHLRPPRLQCVVPPGTARVRRPGLQCWLAALTDEDVRDIGGVPATTPVRTALDLARYAPRYLGLAAIDAYTRQRLVELGHLVRRARELSGARNIARARVVLELCDPAAESAGESWLRLRLFEAGLPRPEAQISIRDGGREVYRLDMGYREARVAVEYDGEAHHHMTAAQQTVDERRRADLHRRFGWHVIGVHRGDVLGRRNDLERTVAGLIGHTGVLLARQEW